MREFTCKIKAHELRNKKVLYPISMENPLQQAEALQIVLDQITSSAPQSFKLLVCDGLYRHNELTDNSDDNLALKQALQKGDDFLAKHKDILQSIEIIRWNDLINIYRSLCSDAHKQIFFDKYQEIINSKKIQNLINSNITKDKSIFELAETLIKTLYEKDDIFVNKIKQTWSQHVKEPIASTNNNPKLKKNLDSSISYQLEKYSLILCLALYIPALEEKQLNFDILLYATGQTPGIDYVFKKYLGGDKSRLKYVSAQVTDLQKQNSNNSSNTSIHELQKELRNMQQVVLEQQLVLQQQQKEFIQTINALQRQISTMSKQRHNNNTRYYPRNGNYSQYPKNAGGHSYNRYSQFKNNQTAEAENENFSPLRSSQYYYSKRVKSQT